MCASAEFTPTSWCSPHRRRDHRRPVPGRDHGIRLRFGVRSLPAHPVRPLGADRVPGGIRGGPGHRRPRPCGLVAPPTGCARGQRPYEVAYAALGSVLGQPQMLHVAMSASCWWCRSSTPSSPCPPCASSGGHCPGLDRRDARLGRPMGVPVTDLSDFVLSCRGDMPAGILRIPPVNRSCAIPRQVSSISVPTGAVRTPQDGQATKDPPEPVLGGVAPGRARFHRRPAGTAPAHRRPRGRRPLRHLRPASVGPPGPPSPGCGQCGMANQIRRWPPADQGPDPRRNGSRWPTTSSPKRSPCPGCRRPADPQVMGRLAAVVGQTPGPGPASVNDQQYSPYKPVPILARRVPVYSSNGSLVLVCPTWR